MNIIERIKADRLEARKNRDKVKASLLATLLSSIEVIGINDGKRDTTEEEALKEIVIFKKNVVETLDNLTDYKMTPEQEVKYEACLLELELYKEYLPTELSIEALRAIIEDLIKEFNVTDIKGMGRIMGSLNKTHKNQFSGSEVKDILIDILK